MRKGERVDSLDSSSAMSFSSGPAASAPTSAVSSVSQQLSRVIQSATIQPKLKIGEPGDRFEQQADQVAEKVIAAPSPFGRSPVAHQPLEEDQSAQTRPIQRQAEEEEEPVQAKSLIQRQAEEEEEPVQAKLPVQRQAEEEEEPVQEKSLIQQQAEEEQEPVQAKSLVQRQTEEEEEPVHEKSLIQRQAEEEEEPVQAKLQVQRQTEEEKPVRAKADTSGTAGSSLQSQLTSTKGFGNPLSENTRSFMEPRFGRDFGNVRIHTDSNAVTMSKGLGAQAFTHGSDIYFNEGKYDPYASSGKRLLAHELSHTIQQGASPGLKPLAMTNSTVQMQEASVEERTDLEAELAAANEEAAAAVDPAPAEQAKQQAHKEGPELEGKKSTKETTVKPTKEPEGAEGQVQGKPAKKVKTTPAPFVQEEKKGEEEQGEVGRYLTQQSAGVLPRVAARTQILANNEQTHDDAEAKLSQSEAAVSPPEAEGQAQSNAEQIENLDKAPVSEPDDQKARNMLNLEVERSVPREIEQINEFKSKGKAKVVGNRVLGTVKEDTSAVEAAYNKIETAPPPKPQEKVPIELPGEEVVPETAELGLGKGAVPPLKEEHTDFTEFDQKSDKMLVEEGITDEQLNMVDEGELAEAKKERRGLKQKVVEQPAQLQEFAQQQVQQVDKDMGEEEKKSRTQMRSKRKLGLAATRDKQSKTKTALELKREAVTKKINGIYEKAKASVTAKLNSLEKESLATFDRGQEKASREFEDDVNRDIDAWKRKRYSGFWGDAKWLKDKICGIDDFPEVKRAFERAKASYVAKIDNLILDIKKASQKVITECKQELAAAQKEIKTYVDGLGPQLKATGRQAMTEMKSKLAKMDKFIDKKKQDLVQKLADKKDEAIKKIDEKIEKMKEEMSGALAKLGNFLLEAMLKFFKWALKKAGYNATQLMGIINKGKAVIKKIVGDPIGFIMNIVNAVKTGIMNFQTNIRKHLVGGLIGWLTGKMGDIGIQLPEKFDLKGILSIVLQILGLTWTSIRQKLVKRLGEKVVRAAEKTIDIVKRIIAEGPIALWNMIKEKAAEIKEQVMEGIRNWAIVELVKQGIIKLLSFLNPAGAIVQAILAIYNTIMFFVENWDRIVQFVKTVFNSIADIAMGKIGAAAAAVERALAMTIPIILNFLARLLNLSGIGKAVQKIIMKIRKPIDKVVDRAVAFIAKKAKALLTKGKAAVARGKAAVKTAAGKIVEWWKMKKRVKLGTDSHLVMFKGKGRGAQIVIRSEEETLKSFLAGLKDEGYTEAQLRQPEEYAAKIEAEKASNKAEDKKAVTINKLFNDLVTSLSKIRLPASGKNTPPSYGPKYHGFYGSLAKVDKLAIGHQEGSESSSIPGGNFDKLAHRKYGNGAFYIRGHLLNAKLGGPGNDWRNLTPLFQNVNKEHHNKFEKHVKDAVHKEGKQVLNFRVQALYGRSPSADIARLRDPKDDDILNKLNPNNNEPKVLADLLEAELMVPTKLDCSASWKKGRKEGKLDVPPIINDISYGDLSKYHLNPKARTDFNITQQVTGVKRDKALNNLMQLDGVGMQEAGRIFNRLVTEKKKITNYVAQIGISKKRLEELNETKRIKQ